MSRIIKGTMSVGTRYVGSKVRENFEIEVPEEATDTYIEQVLEELYTDFMYNEVTGGWTIESDELE